MLRNALEELYPPPEMTLKERVRSLPFGHCVHVCAPHREHIIFGTREVRIQRTGEVIVRYCDGTEVKRIASDEVLDMLEADEFGLQMLVSFVEREGNFK